jgi:hypothetical protein
MRNGIYSFFVEIIAGATLNDGSGHRKWGEEEKCVSGYIHTEINSIIYV